MAQLPITLKNSVGEADYLRTRSALHSWSKFSKKSPSYKQQFLNNSLFLIITYWTITLLLLIYTLTQQLGN